MGQLRYFRGRYHGQDHDQERDRCDPGEEADQNQESAHDLEGTYKMRGEVGMRKADPSEAIHAHIRVDVLEDALRAKDQADSQPNEQYGTRPPGGTNNS